jgi:hypothetical protein
MTTQFKTPKDAKEAINLVAESATKAAEDAKFAVDELSNFVAKATEDNQAMLAFNQKLLQTGFEAWQNYTQAYLEFVLSAAQRTVEQSFAFREGLDKLVVDSFKRNQGLIQVEQGVAFDAFDAFESQFKATSKRVAKGFNIPSLN